MCLLKQEHTITYSFAKRIENKGDLAVNLKKRQGSEEYIELHHECAVDKTQIVGKLLKSRDPGSSIDKL